MIRDKAKEFQMSRVLKALLKLLLFLASAGIPYYFRFVLGMEVAVADLLYAPVLLAALWWPRIGALVALSLGLLLIGSHLVIEPTTPLLHDLQRSLTLWAIALVMSVLSREVKEAEREIRQRNEELSALNAIVSTASQFLDLDEILEVTLDKMLETMGAELGGIYLLDEGRGKLVAKVYRGVSPEFVEEAMKLDDGLAGQTLRSGEPMVMDDLSGRPEFIQVAMNREGLQSYVSVPLKSKEKVLGVMDVITHRPHRLTPRDVELLTSIGNHIGVTIENARLFEETRRRLQESEVLFQVAKGLTSVLDLERLLQLIIDSAVETIGPAERGVIHLLGEASGELHPKALAGMALGTPGETKMRIGEGIAGLAIEGGETINVPDVNADPRFLRPAGPDELKSLLVAPLLIGARRIGTISVEGGEMDAFSPDDERLLTTLASQAAIAIENARLFKELERARMELEEWSKELERRVEERTRELKEAQDRLIHAERLATIGQLGASVAHELRHPLSVINNSVYYFKMKLRDVDEKVEKHLKIMEREITTANKIISDLLSFARGKKPSLQKAQVNTIIQDVLSRTTLPEKVTVVTELAEGLPPLMADPGQMEQVFINMISNAVQAMSNEGRLEIATKMGDGFVVTEFTDTGRGISEEDMKKLFEPLFTTKAKGIGLGLAVSKQLIEAHKGTIEVESKMGQGTTFRVRLPLGKTNKPSHSIT